MTLMCIFIATNLTKKNKNSLSRLKYKNKNSSLKLLKRGPLPPQLQRPAFFRLRPFDTSFYVLAHVHQHEPRTCRLRWQVPRTCRLWWQVPRMCCFTWPSRWGRCRDWVFCRRICKQKQKLLFLL